MKFVSSFIGAASLLLAAAQANAVSYGFYLITNNGNGDISNQLTVDVTNGSGAKFKFSNLGPIASSISEIYFDDNADVLNTRSSTFNQSAGVDWRTGANPNDLPGGNTVGFDSDNAFNSEAKNPAPSKGVNPNEYVELTFSLKSGKTFADVQAAIDAGNLRMGMHVISIGQNGGSDSYVNKSKNPPNQVPDAGSTAMLLGLGLTGLLALRRGSK